MARKSGKSNGKLALQLALVMAGFGLVAGLILAVAVVQNLSSGIEDPEVLSRGWKVALGMTVFAAVICAIGGWVMGGRIASRIVDVGLAVAKLGRGGSEVRVRVGGNDEVTALGRSVQYLASDLAALLQDEGDAGGSSHVSLDPLVRQLRDRAVPQQLPELDGYEVDAALAPGSRGGLDYYDVVATTADGPGMVLSVVSAEGHGALSVYACRLARDELLRALMAGAAPRKALAHANKVMQQALPTGCCAKATLLLVRGDSCKLYQAGVRSPLLICQRGEVLELNAEGIALGLDSGPVFEKSLRPQEIAMSPGIRLVLGNDAMHRAEGLLDLLRQHSPRHTRMFMNMVLGSIEQDGGAEGLREEVLLLTVKMAGQA